ncbi:MAG: PilT/PilU family type 4a pilus ATPase [Betaproteobacteria bacterium]|nr:PilT/PilU family type 4a pilus ATPase [Betaproteobacteria bacterium]
MVLHDLLAIALAHHASDLHLASNAPPKMRVQGMLQTMTCAEPIPTTVCANGSDVQATLHHPLSNESLRQMLQPKMNAATWAHFQQGHEVDFSFAIPTLGRFRANAFSHQLGSGVVLRHIPSHIPTLADLQAPAVLAQLLQQVGLLLVTGPTGSGKSTTLAAMVQHLNLHTQQHIITLEDPIEFVHKPIKSIITQREVGKDTMSFASALKGALRQDPDVILMGEMRDYETVSMGMTAAETGHLVFATLHTNGAPETINRIVDVFPAEEQAKARSQLSQSLRLVMTQQLLKRKGGGRVGCFEIMVNTPAVANLIREDKIVQIPNVMQTGAQHGMITMEKYREMLESQKIL